VKTQVLTFPDGAIVEFNGEYLGRAPAEVVLPQDPNGRLTGRAVVRALPNTQQPSLFAQTRVFDPIDRVDRVPNRIMIDMRLKNGSLPPEWETTHVETATKSSPRPKIPYTERSKPTQAVGIDRWNPGHH